jgi:hypothetical protein
MPKNSPACGALCACNTARRFHRSKQNTAIMGKKSRRQREKALGIIPQPNKVPPVMRGTIRKNNNLRILYAKQGQGREALAAFDTACESHKVRPTALRLLGTKRMYSYSDDEWEINQRVWAMRTAIVARHPEDEVALDEYLCAVVGNQFFKMYLNFAEINEDAGAKLRKYMPLHEAAVARWPRVKPHWRRFRRRLCTRCHNHAHLSQPRYLVCSACGVARYCSEECHALDWAQHQKECCGVGGLPGGRAHYERLISGLDISKEDADRYWEESKHTN